METTFSRETFSRRVTAEDKAKNLVESENRIGGGGGGGGATRGSSRGGQEDRD